ncbi:MAG TPA: phosphoribosylamine--glycine ligase [Nitrospiria bacterium]
MKSLVIGNGGREHALVWRLAQSPRTPKLFCAPGNPGTARLAKNISLSPGDLEGLLKYAKKEEMDLTMVGPELPLTLGIVDRFRGAGLRIVGPSRAAARLEGSKVFSKTFMEKHGIPTGEARSFTDSGSAIRYIKETGGRVVVKADGLAAGKGVVVAGDESEAIEAVRKIMEEKVFGDAGETVLIEERLTGQEVSLLAFTDGETIVPLPVAQDHKAVFDGDRGPNTGGMGAYSPAPVLNEELRKKIMKEVIERAVAGMSADGTPYRGVLYAGLMLTPKGPRVLEFNARFGDPETQPLMMRLESDLVEVFEGIADGTLGKRTVRWRPESAVCVVMASGGYPGSYEKGIPVTGIRKAERDESVVVFHAGTARENGRLVTGGGRVLGVTALGPDIATARERAYKAAGKIKFDGAHYRKDIGQKALSTGRENS